jgi:hypothetical protein
MLRNHFCVIAANCAVIALAACDRDLPAGSPNGGEPADAPAPPSITPPDQVAGQAPRLRAGLWSVSTIMDGSAQTARMCLDDAVQTRMSVMGGQMAGGACQQAEVTPRPGGGWAMRSVCDMGSGGRMVSEGVVTGDPQSRYRSEMTVTTSGAAVAHMNRTVTHVSEGRHEGPCPADMRAGDMEMAGGMRLNMLDMAEQASRMGAP